MFIINRLRGTNRKGAGVVPSARPGIEISFSENGRFFSFCFVLRFLLRENA